MNKVVKIFLVTVVFLFYYQIGNSQSITFQKVYGIGPREEIGLSVVQTNDNGYMVVGGGYKCLRTDQYGDTLWTGRVPSPANCVQKTFGNNFIYTSPQFELLKFDIDGITLWSRDYYKPSTITGFIDETSDRGFILSGASISGNDIYPYILKTDSLGYFKWDKVFDSYHFRTSVKIVSTTDHGYVFTGVDTGAYAIKIDSAGNFLWYKNYKPLMQNSSSIIKLNDGFLICGNDKLLRIDEDGGVIWSKTYSLGINRETYFYSLIQTNDHGYALTGVRDTTFETDYAPLVLLLKADSSGNQQWYKLLGIQNSLNDYSSGRDIRQTNDSGFIITGIIDTNSFNNYNSANNDLFGGDLILIKTDKTGNISTEIVNNTNNIPNYSKLYQNYPNPFNPKTIIKFEIPIKSFTTLKVLNLLGKEVSILVNEYMYSGVYEVEFNAHDLPSGIYFYRLEVKNNLENKLNFVTTKKMLIIK